MLIGFLDISSLETEWEITFQVANDRLIPFLNDDVQAGYRCSHGIFQAVKLALERIKLNSTQEAILKNIILSSEAHPRTAVIKGSPDTGKTQVVASLASVLLYGKTLKGL